MGDPVRVWVADGAVPPLAGPVPPPGDPVWEVEYRADPRERGKRTARRNLPTAAEHALAVLAGADVTRAWCDWLGYPVLPDPTGWGGGLQVLPPGGRLGVHLDGDRHPRLPHWRRALAAVAFLHPVWEPGWGGALVFTDPDGRPWKRVEPVPGRVVAWEQSDLAYHGVGPVTGPAERVTACAFYLAPATAASTRTRALFLPDR